MVAGQSLDLRAQILESVIPAQAGIQCFSFEHSESATISVRPDSFALESPRHANNGRKAR